jgi:uncharacterized protein with von Willebrand factor type A (vWA) domain
MAELKMKTLKWAGARGNEIELRARCEIKLVNKEVDLDGQVIVSDEKRQQVDANLELWVDGKLVDSCRDINFWRTIDIDIDNGLKKIWGLKVAMTAEQAEKVEQWLIALIEDGKTDEYRAWETAKAKAKADAEAAKVKAEDQKRRHPGYCPKCESYCYGDCDSNK